MKHPAIVDSSQRGLWSHPFTIHTHSPSLPVNESRKRTGSRTIPEKTAKRCAAAKPKLWDLGCFPFDIWLQILAYAQFTYPNATWSDIRRTCQTFRYEIERLFLKFTLPTIAFLVQDQRWEFDGRICEDFHLTDWHLHPLHFLKGQGTPGAYVKFSTTCEEVELTEKLQPYDPEEQVRLLQRGYVWIRAVLTDNKESSTDNKKSSTDNKESSHTWGSGKPPERVLVADCRRFYTANGGAHLDIGIMFRGRRQVMLMEDRQESTPKRRVWRMDWKKFIWAWYTDPEPCRSRLC